MIIRIASVGTAQHTIMWQTHARVQSVPRIQLTRFIQIVNVPARTTNTMNISTSAIWFVPTIAAGIFHTANVRIKRKVSTKVQSRNILFRDERLTNFLIVYWPFWDWIIFLSLQIYLHVWNVQPKVLLIAFTRIAKQTAFKML